MIIELTTHKDKNFSFDYFIPAEVINLEDETVKLNDAVKIQGNLAKGIVQVDIDGKIYADVELECSRCLQAVRQFLEFPFQAVFVTPENYTDEREVQLQSEDLEVSIFGGDKIDLTELAREQILLAAPAQVFCQEDCKGLCQKCGANKNLINCNCEEKEVDPQMGGFKRFKVNIVEVLTNSGKYILSVLFSAE
jgi:uncharacterized protein